MKNKNLCTRIGIAAAFLALQLLVLSPASAQTPSRDLTFGNKGTAFLNLYDSLAFLGMVNDYVLDKDGNIYVLVPRSVTQLNGLNDNDGLVIKINSAGIPDRTFNGMGYAVIHNMTLFPNWDQPYRWSTYLRVSGDGSKITVYSGQFGDVIHSYRLTSDGLPDYSYGDKGCRNISLPTFGGILQDIKQTADGGVI